MLRALPPIFTGLPAPRGLDSFGTDALKTGSPFLTDLKEPVCQSDHQARPENPKRPRPRPDVGDMGGHNPQETSFVGGYQQFYQQYQAHHPLNPRTVIVGVNVSFLCGTIIVVFVCPKDRPRFGGAAAACHAGDESELIGRRLRIGPMVDVVPNRSSSPLDRTMGRPCHSGSHRALLARGAQITMARGLPENSSQTLVVPGKSS